MRPEKLVDFLEATYALDLDDETWLKEVLGAVRKVWGRPGGGWAMLYDASDVHHFRSTLMTADSLSPDISNVLGGGIGLMTAGFVIRTFRRVLSSNTARKDASPELDSMYQALEKHGMADNLAINGLNPNGRGCFVGLTMSERRNPPQREMAIYRRMALHLAAAFRCRQRLHADARGARPDPTFGAEAVIDSRGRIVDASGPATDRLCQEEIKEGLRRFDVARSRRHGCDPVDGLVEHRALVDGRWTLVDLYERNGTRFVVARENQAEVRGLANLTERERQVTVYLSLGRSTKEIAYALGISDSTVRVHVSHATSKLGVRNRDQLVRQATPDALPDLTLTKPRAT